MAWLEKRADRYGIESSRNAVAPASAPVAAGADHPGPQPA